MADRVPVPLTPVRLELGSREYEAVVHWLYQDLYVARLLRSDIPRRMTLGNCTFWTYCDSAGRVVGFGTLDVCDDYLNYTAGVPHSHIPLLAVNPAVKSLGYGTTIVRHLTTEAAVLATAQVECSELVLLEVYTDNTKAHKLYVESGFFHIIPEPIPDPLEGGKPYIVMAKRVVAAQSEDRQ